MSFIDRMRSRSHESKENGTKYKNNVAKNNDVNRDYMANQIERETVDIQDIQIPEEAKSYIAVKGNTVFIANDKVNDVLVRNYLNNLLRRNVDFEKQLVSVSEIASQNDQENQTKVTNTLTERDCKDLIRQAVDAEASDIHIHNKSNQQSSTILFRVNGSLRKFMELSYEDGQSLCRTFYGPLASVKDTEWQPTEFQDARVAGRGWFPPGVYSLRIASTPTDDGSRMVIRVLYDVTSANEEQNGTNALKALGFSDHHIDSFQIMMGRPSGLIIFSGPTGSGKSTTIKYELERVMARHSDRHLVTVEDPPEYPIHNATQIPLTGASGRSTTGRQEGYADRIRATMRLDPDLMMIGEVRDGASAKAAIESAQTGHKVWTTLHANNVWDILDRYESLLQDVGITNSRTLLGNVSNVSGLVAQRLVPTICSNCAVGLDDAIHDNRLHRDAVKQLETVFDGQDTSGIRIRGDGCDNCQGNMSPDERAKDPNKGITGRTVVSESVSPDYEMMEMYRREGPSRAMRVWSQNQNSQTYIEHAIEKIRYGIVDPESAITVVGDLTSVQSNQGEEFA